MSTTCTHLVAITAAQLAAETGKCHQPNRNERCEGVSKWGIGNILLQQGAVAPPSRTMYPNINAVTLILIVTYSTQYHRVYSLIWHIGCVGGGEVY